MSENKAETPKNSEPTESRILVLPGAKAEETKPDVAAPEIKPEDTITPFADTGEIVRAFPHPKFPEQYILADAKGNVLAVTPSLNKAELVYNAINGYFRAMAQQQAMAAQRQAENAKRVIDSKIITARR